MKNMPDELFHELSDVLHKVAEYGVNLMEVLVDDDNREEYIDKAVEYQLFLITQAWDDLIISQNFIRKPSFETAVRGIVLENILDDNRNMML